MRFAAFSQRVESGVRCAQTLLSDARLLLRRLALTVEPARNRRHQQRAILRVGLVFLRHHLILLCELLVGKIAYGLL